MTLHCWLQLPTLKKRQIFNFFVFQTFYLLLLGTSCNPVIQKWINTIYEKKPIHSWEYCGPTSRAMYFGTVAWLFFPYRFTRLSPIIVHPLKTYWLTISSNLFWSIKTRWTGWSNIHYFPVCRALYAHLVLNSSIANLPLKQHLKSALWTFFVYIKSTINLLIVIFFLWE